jgi:hypothetical protein
MPFPRRAAPPTQSLRMVYNAHNADRPYDKSCTSAQKQGRRRSYSIGSLQGGSCAGLRVDLIVISFRYRRAAVEIKPISADSLRKTGIFAEKAGDFRRFPPSGSRNWESGDEVYCGKRRHFQPILGSLAESAYGCLGRQVSNRQVPNCRADTQTTICKKPCGGDSVAISEKEKAARKERPSLFSFVFRRLFCCGDMI